LHDQAARGEVVQIDHRALLGHRGLKVFEPV
jgi:hypothetical protein